MNSVSDLIKFSFYDSVAKEKVDIVELDELKDELRELIEKNGLKDKWVKEFFEL